jgi:hypothetical protein
MSTTTTDAETSTTPWPNTEELLEQYDHWQELPGIDRDDYSAFRKLAALYRFALTHMDSPGNHLLFEAIAAVEQTWKD